ncbi:dihydrodipicolinate synthetase-like protein [Mollisia scopiformis]|uniref:Dihydrodipicolinate synthetase-like protein n=1 Tax=Mollisia scopiformis TaxID=149040 RepID=A0A194XE67_MOLSC|nr:dihydrodipicolinate synthetase-like protein [Mollisia scopiformis]KUJ18436.1 dihydrodipicolinate synthetase-like protein [Mollisia scopiformis]
MATPPPAGIYVPVPTFFVSKKAANYSPTAAPLDLETQAAHSLHLAKSGITGLVVLGSTGEAVHLSNKERFAVLSSVRKAYEDAGFKDYPLIAGTAAQNIEEIVEQLKSAKEAGCQWGLCLVPGYFAGASTQDGIIQWFTAVADQSPIPVMVYHYPGVSNNVKVVPSTYATLSKHPNIVGCKLSHGDVSYHAQIGANPKIDHTHFHTFTGLGQQLLPVISLGCAGTIDGTAGFFPKSVVHLYKLSVNNRPTDEEVKERRLLQYKLSAVEELVVKFGTVGIKEAISRILGMGDRDGTRLPLTGGIPGGDKEWENWEECVGDLDAVEKSL